MKIAIVDYGLGNLFSIGNACKLAGHLPIITSDKTELINSDALILPGVGAFGDAMDSLEKNDLISLLKDFAASGKPFMGICLGMQLLFTESEEFGNHKGLNLIDGNIKRFPSTDKNGSKIRVPQIQWNQIYDCNNQWKDSLYKEIPNESYMHFVHSYFAIPEKNNDVLSETEYGGVKYASSVLRNNIIGIQFHPEKSGEIGLSIYKNWKLN